MRIFNFGLAVSVRLNKAYSRTISADNVYRDRKLYQEMQLHFPHTELSVMGPLATVLCFKHELQSRYQWMENAALHCHAVLEKIVNEKPQILNHHFHS